MMNCASSEISPSNFWSRAQSALVASASQERVWSTIVSTAASKLQVPDGGIYEVDAKILADLGARMPDGSEQLAAWCELAERDAVYVIALCRLVRAEQKAAKKAKRAERLTTADIGDLS